MPLVFADENTCSKRPWNTTNEDSFAWIQRLWPIHHKVSIRQTPWPHLHLKEQPKITRQVLR